MGPAGRVTFQVRVKTRSRTEGIVGRVGDRLKVAVRTAPEQGRANRRVCEVLAEALGVPAARVTIVAGATHPEKTVAAAGIDPAAVARLAPDTQKVGSHGR